jgi:hypothetical protein
VRPRLVGKDARPDNVLKLASPVAAEQELFIFISDFLARVIKNLDKPEHIVIQIFKN